MPIVQRRPGPVADDASLGVRLRKRDGKRSDGTLLAVFEWWCRLPAGPWQLCRQPMYGAIGHRWWN